MIIVERDDNGTICIHPGCKPRDCMFHRDMHVNTAWYACGELKPNHPVPSTILCPIHPADSLTIVSMAGWNDDDWDNAADYTLMLSEHPGYSVINGDVT